MRWLVLVGIAAVFGLFLIGFMATGSTVVVMTAVVVGACDHLRRLDAPRPGDRRAAGRIR